MKTVAYCCATYLRYDKQLEFKTDLLGQPQLFKPANFESYDISSNNWCWSNHNITEPNYYLNLFFFDVASFRPPIIAESPLANIDDCPVQDDLTQAIMNKVTNLLDKYRLIYNERKIAGIPTAMT